MVFFWWCKKRTCRFVFNPITQNENLRPHGYVWLVSDLWTLKSCRNGLAYSRFNRRGTVPNICCTGPVPPGCFGSAEL